MGHSQSVLGLCAGTSVANKAEEMYFIKSFYTYKKNWQQMEPVHMTIGHIVATGNPLEKPMHASNLAYS